ASSDPTLEPVQALNAQPVNLPMGGDAGNSQPSPAPISPITPADPIPPMAAPQPQSAWNSGPDPQQQPAGFSSVIQPQGGMPANPAQQFPAYAAPGQPIPGITDQPIDPNAPPPVPPPMMPPANP
ncbi:MAG: hypothetical protein AAB834_03760, partial [Patescibacteria group bacterium]